MQPQNEHTNTTSFCIFQSGAYTKVSDPSNLRFAMGSYYDFFSESTYNTQPVITVPYFDAFGLGLVTSICLPFHSAGALQGVACVDASMSDLLADVTFFGRTSTAYAFITGPNGRLFTHPLLPTPSSLSEEPNYLQATAVETSPPARQVVASMRRWVYARQPL